MTDAHPFGSRTDGHSTQRGLVVGGIIHRDGLVLAARRSRPVELSGLFELPGGKVEPGETPIAALRRELVEELGVHVVVDAELESMAGAWPINDKLEMRVWFCEVEDGEPVAGDSHDQILWVHPAELPTLDWLPADRHIVEVIAQSARQL